MDSSQKPKQIISDNFKSMPGLKKVVTLAIQKLFVSPYSLGKAFLVSEDSSSKKMFLKRINIQLLLRYIKQDEIDNILDKIKSPRHKNVEHYVDSFQDDKDICLLMNYSENSTSKLYLQGTLSEMLDQTGSLNEDTAFRIFFQVLCGIKHLHSCNMYHGSLKLSNILVKENNQCTVVDYGWYKLFKHRTLKRRGHPDGRYIVRYSSNTEVARGR